MKLETVRKLLSEKLTAHVREEMAANEFYEDYEDGYADGLEYALAVIEDVIYDGDVA